MKKPSGLSIILSRVLSEPTIFFVGLVLMAVGVYLIYPPAMFVSVGIVLMAISLFGNGGEK